MKFAKVATRNVQHCEPPLGKAHNQTRARPSEKRGAQNGDSYNDAGQHAPLLLLAFIRLRAAQAVFAAC
jgi:hypothetical protein